MPQLSKYQSIRIFTKTALPSWLALIALTSFTGLGCKRAEANQEKVSAAEPVVKAKTITTQEQQVPEYLLLTGNLSAFQQADMAANAMGRVVATYAERGQAVKKGDLIATLDARSASLVAVAAQAQSNLARTQLELARRDCARAQSLFDSGALNRSEYDRITTQCTSSQFSAAAADANQQVAAKNVGDSAIRAPFTGVIGERYVNVGEYVQPNSKVVSIYAVDPLRLELTVPEAAVSRIRQDAPVEFSVAAFEKEKFAGTVRFISPNVRRTSRDLVVEALVPNTDAKLRPGMFASVRLPAGNRNLPVIPATAVRMSGESARIFVVSQKRAEERVVQLGEKINDSVAVLRGLSKGEVIVEAPSAELRDGVRVE